MSRTSYTRRALLALPIFAATGAVLATDAAAQRWGLPRRPAPGWVGPDSLVAQDHNRARDGVRAGRIVPLSAVLANIRRSYPGKQLDTHTVGGPSGPVRYEVRWLTPDGRRLDITADARTGQILSVRGQ